MYICVYISIYLFIYLFIYILYYLYIFKAISIHRRLGYIYILTLILR